MKIKKFLEKINKSYNFHYSLLINKDGENIAEFGYDAPSISRGLYNYYIGSSDSIKNTFAFLKGQLTPQFIGQGNKNLILFQPTPDLILGCINDDDRTLEELIVATDILDLEIKKYINEQYLK